MSPTRSSAVDLAVAHDPDALVGDVVPPPAPGDATLVDLACLDDDAQGERLMLLWEHEPDAMVVAADGLTGRDSDGLVTVCYRTCRRLGRRGVPGYDSENLGSPTVAQMADCWRRQFLPSLRRHAQRPPRHKRERN